MSGRSHWGWVAAGYLVGTIPSAYIAARLTDARTVVERASATGSEGDAHLLLASNGSPAAAAGAMAGDVAKGAMVAYAAQRAGLDPGWRAATGVAVVAGHTFPFYWRAFAGRGLAAAAGVTLVNLPREMVVAGSVLLAGKTMGHTGPGSTLGFAAVPVVAAVRREPRALAAMGAGILGIILARRLVGVRSVAARDGWTTAVARRLMYDADETASAPSGH